MSEPFIGEIRLFAFNYEPVGWAVCEGQTLPIRSYTALFSILGTHYGGDGVTNFKLPDLRGRAPALAGKGLSFGQPGGEPFHVLTSNELPSHTHSVYAGTSAPATGKPAGQVWTQAGTNQFASSPNSLMDPNAIASAGESLGHDNRQPYTVVSFCIALNGIFPSRN